MLLRQLKRPVYLFWLKYLKRRLGQDPFFTTSPLRSDLPINVLIPVIEKDLSLLPYVVESIRENVLHPIKTIYIVAPPQDSIQQCCIRIYCQFVNEEEVLPISKKDISYTGYGEDRSGWLFQQLLKLSADTISDLPHTLVVDADTLLIRPQLFYDQNQVFFSCSDEYHFPYQNAYRALTGYFVTSSLSFVAHHMPLETTKLQKLKHHIESLHGIPWYEAILRCADKNHGSGFSEYETYGNFVLKHYFKEVRRFYFYNMSISRKQLNDFPSLKKELSKKFKSLSFHSYD